MKICFYAGSFDPFTVGHLHVVKNASMIYDKVFIGIGTNPDKTRTVDKEEMKQAITETVSEIGLTNIEVVIYEGDTADVAKNLNVTHFIRGIRNGKDYEYEKVSSSYVREKLENDQDVSLYVSEPVLRLIKKHI